MYQYKLNCLLITSKVTISDVDFDLINTSKVTISDVDFDPVFWYHILPSFTSLCKNLNILADILPLPISSQPWPSPLGGTGTSIMISPKIKPAWCYKFIFLLKINNICMHGVVYCLQSHTHFSDWRPHGRAFFIE